MENLHTLKTEILELKKDKQKLVDIMYEIGLVIASDDFDKNKSNEEIAQWISRQLELCDFNTEPVGSSWGVLK